jgi:hypothetical protein
MGKTRKLFQGLAKPPSPLLMPYTLRAAIPGPEDWASLITLKILKNMFVKFV